MLRLIATEFIGTFFLVLSISLCVALPLGGLAPIGIGVTLIAMVYMGGHVSGAHYNPAVSLGAMITRNIPAGRFVLYVLVQVAAGLVAAGVGVMLTGKSPAPMPMIAPAGALLAEILFTFALVLVVLNVACAPACKGNSYYGVAIGLTVMAGAFAVGPLSGAALNPAVGLGLCLVDGLRGGASLPTVWIYIVGPLVGGILAAVVYQVQNPEMQPATEAAGESDGPDARDGGRRR